MVNSQISVVLRPVVRRLLVARVTHLVKNGRPTEAKAQIIWGHSFDYIDEDETAELIHEHGLAGA